MKNVLLFAALFFVLSCNEIIQNDEIEFRKEKKKESGPGYLLSEYGCNTENLNYDLNLEFQIYNDGTGYHFRLVEIGMYGDENVIMTSVGYNEEYQVYQGLFQFMNNFQNSNNYVVYEDHFDFLDEFGNVIATSSIVFDDICALIRIALVADPETRIVESME